ncbi:sulfotransferase [Pseudomonas sp. MG-9]|uniref:Sulfotransferase n=1 Tax=Pseudomonas serboccidentalis TaxID=2964670 RepID=A0ABY7Z597_9PSED|nr:MULTISPECIES: sulfotransferase [Pseudomonas]MBT9267038.1 sulfotransferase [Pseudomonas sp. MG-9]WDR34133.1 sulfotransferase [Pseudomonas serboccidentalis]
MNNPTAILVLGMPRSGTSAVTRVLNLRGAALSGNLLPAAKPNPKGFFESADALAIHERLLTALGRTWFDVSEMPEGWLEHPATQKAHEELVELVRREYSDQTLWIIKEPRMCRIVPLWLRVLRSLNIAPRALLVTRHPDEVASSVARMVGEEQWGPRHTEILWLEYFFEAEKATREIPRSIITYDQLLADWAASVERVAAELKLEWPVSIADSKQEVDAYLGVENRHHDHNSNADPQRKGRTFAERVYSVCNEMQSDYWQVIENAQIEFSEMLALFSSPMREAVNRALEQRDEEKFLQQAELDGLRQHHNDVFFKQHAELIELKNSQKKMEEALSESKVEISKLINSLNEVSYELGIVAAREESCQQQLRDAQASYTELLALTSSRTWLAKKLFSIEKK